MGLKEEPQATGMPLNMQIIVSIIGIFIQFRMLLLQPSFYTLFNQRPKAGIKF